MLAKTESVAFVGADARPVEVEVDVSTGVPRFTIVGLPAASVREAEQRTRAALMATEERWPPARITANLAPGALRKEGPHFDLAIALGVLIADARLEAEALEEWVTVGELALDGSVRPVRGTLAAAMTCRKHGRKGLICPAANASEARLVEGIEVVPVSKLRDCILWVKGDWLPGPIEATQPTEIPYSIDLHDVRGHDSAKKSLEIAAAGGHHLMLTGPPGSGKTMLASRLPTILPKMTTEESLEVTQIFSVAGLMPEPATLLTDRPFRVPHHHISLAGLVGGGSGLARPGEISLAHHGVLFLDEITLYRSQVLESLRTPLEEGVVRIARSGGSITYPCRFALVAARNPCRCGFMGDTRKACRCSDQQIQSYESRVSGPLLDRFDLKVWADPLTKDELLGPPSGDSSAVVRARVEAARVMQGARYSNRILTNASVTRREFDERCALSPQAHRTLGEVVDHLHMSGRGVNRLLRVARTVADLAGAERLERDHVYMAMQHRQSRAAGAAA